MPELPEVETTKRGVSPHVSGHCVRAMVVRQGQLRWPVPLDLPKQLTGKVLRSVARRGKYLLLQFDHGTVLVHLGMSGNLRVVDEHALIGKHDHIDIQFDNGRILRFTDPRRFGCVLWTAGPVEQHSLIAHLGPEPLTDDFYWEYLYQRSRKRSQAIKTFIMDSKVVVGVGNIYANEALFKTGIRPTRAAGKVTKAQMQQLVEHIKVVLAKAIEQGGTTLKDFVGGTGKPGYFKQELAVYGRAGEPCAVCATVLKEIRLGQRSTVYCPMCQK